MVAFILDVPVFGPSGRASNAGIGWLVGLSTVQETGRNDDRQTPETTCHRAWAIGVVAERIDLI